MSDPRFKTLLSECCQICSDHMAEGFDLFIVVNNPFEVPDIIVVLFRVTTATRQQPSAISLFTAGRSVYSV
jgi:hypothetical protein